MNIVFNAKQRIALAGTACIFFIDLMVPLGVAVGAFYTVLFLVISTEKPRVIVLFSALFIGLVLFKLLIFVTPQTSWFVYANRSISIVAILAAATYCIRYSKLFIDTSILLEAKSKAIVELQNEFYEQLEHLLEGVQIIGYDWKYKFLNETALKHSRYQHKNDLIGYTMMEKYPGIEKMAFFDSVKNCMENRILSSFENEFVYPDGSVDYFDLIVMPIPEGIFILSLNVADRKKSELARKEQIRVLEDLLFMISHKVRQPIANIMGISHLIQHQPINQLDLVTMSTFIGESAKRLDALTKELNDVIIKSRERHL